MSFSYPSRKEVQVLRNISLAVRAGERIALVGPPERMRNCSNTPTASTGRCRSCSSICPD
ncbi:MAG TPA: hypothetical protein VGY58_23330 [Gemmataceae bacterium]|nr:hypothetical protein [Gemmataceae bacterium]